MGHDGHDVKSRAASFWTVTGIDASGKLALNCSCTFLADARDFLTGDCLLTSRLRPVSQRRSQYARVAIHSVMSSMQDSAPEDDQLGHSVLKDLLSPV